MESELVAFRMEEELHIRQHSSLYGTLQDVFGDEFCQGLKEVDFVKGRLRISGFLSSTQNHTSSKVALHLEVVCAEVLVLWAWY